ncbi:hypothetical protein [Mesorhizobium sp. YM1C-6-2]|uniref:hypothetical protein n=1 Tax=Mesorhizobium sp. YM1C-6-2 TaxID=1827501 RepID=UPI000EF1E9A1|nr:hypothetical protein [Mesorhizobium sp. YM1C-6-2]RLP22476.1 hypothetical protein D8676_24030 [Mesorhizobium sp. YM1C-6-2]
MAAKLLQVIADGGCYWRRQEESRGHSFAVPNATPFKIAMEGPLSNRFREGECRGGYFVMADGTKYISANEAVNTVRDVSSNAFLHVYFYLDGRWVVADDVRESDWSLLDEIDEEALRIAKEDVRRVARQKKADADEVRITRAAAKYALQSNAVMELARMAVEHRKSMASFVTDGLDL